MGDEDEDKGCVEGCGDRGAGENTPLPPTGPLRPSEPKRSRARAYVRFDVV